MNPIFVDSSYFLALLSPRDAWHIAAIHLSGSNRAPVVTTEFVLLEVANTLSSSGRRAAFRAVLDDLHDDPNAVTVPASSELLRAGVNLYLNRPDKEWSLTDCTSFVVMEREGLTEALTADHHFEQAGFKALLR
jgi:predicted nucleic acid-binding protein